MTRRERRMVLVGAVCIAAMLLIRGAPAAWAWRQDLADDVVARAELLSRMQRTVARLPALERDAGELQEQLADLAPQLLEGETPSAAAAALSLRLNSVADRHLLRITAEQSLADSAVDGQLQSVRMRVNLEGDARGMLGGVASLASEPPVTDILALSIEAADPASPPNMPEVLRGELLIRGWYLRGQP